MPQQGGGMSSTLGVIAQTLIARGVITRVTRVGGIPGMVMGAAATYALNRYFRRRR